MGMRTQAQHTHVSALSRIAREPAQPRREIDAGLAQEFHFWQGLTGRRYVHTVYRLIDCPELPEANYVMVRREADGRRTVLRIGRTTGTAPSLNLAHVRHCAAKLGANEVHVHLLCDTLAGQLAVERDLRAGLFAELAAEPTERPRYLC